YSVSQNIFNCQDFSFNQVVKSMYYNSLWGNRLFDNRFSCNFIQNTITNYLEMCIFGTSGTGEISYSTFGNCYGLTIPNNIIFLDIDSNSTEPLENLS